MNPKRVLYVISSSSLGGAERYAASSIKGLSELGIEVHVACPAGPMAAAYRASAASVTTMELDDVFSLADARGIALLARRTGCALVSTHLWNADLLGGLAIRAGGKGALVSTIYGAYHLPVGEPGLRGARRKALSSAYRAVYRLFDRVIAVSDYVRRDLIERRGLRLDPRRVRLVAPALDLRATAEEPVATGFKDPARPRLVCVANFYPIKGQETLIRALPSLRARFPRLECHFVGDGPDRPRLERLAGALGLGATATFRGALNDPRDAVASADLFVLPSLSEGLPHSVLEAWALGTCVLASDAGGIPEVVTQGRTGALVPARDPSALAAAAGRLLEDHALRARLSRAAREELATRFGVARSAAETLAVFNQALARNGSWKWS